MDKPGTSPPTTNAPAPRWRAPLVSALLALLLAGACASTQSAERLARDARRAEASAARFAEEGAALLRAAFPEDPRLAAEFSHETRASGRALARLVAYTQAFEERRLAPARRRQTLAELAEELRGLSRSAGVGLAGASAAEALDAAAALEALVRGRVTGRALRRACRRAAPTVDALALSLDAQLEDARALLELAGEKLAREQRATRAPLEQLVGGLEEDAARSLVRLNALSALRRRVASPALAPAARRELLAGQFEDALLAGLFAPAERAALVAAIEAGASDELREAEADERAELRRLLRDLEEFEERLAGLDDNHAAERARGDDALGALRRTRSALGALRGRHAALCGSRERAPAAHARRGSESAPSDESKGVEP